jgi:hypothetical protein
MLRRLSLLVLLGSSLTLLASLFLEWVQADFGGVQYYFSTRGLLNLFAGGGLSYDGWGPYGQAAALVALALAAAAIASLLRPRLERRLPLASAGVALLYLVLINAAESHGYGVFRGAFEHVPVQLGPGAYLGIGCAAVALLAAVAARWDELARRPSIAAVLALALTIGLLAAFILPWLRLHVPYVGSRATGYQFSGVHDTVAVFIALLACFALPLWRPRTPPGGRLAATLGIAVLVGGGLSTLGITPAHWRYEEWLQLGCSLGLVALALATSRGLRGSRLPIADAGAAVAASLLVVSMFLPWQKASCGGGPCSSASGWTLSESAMAGGLTVILLVLLLGRRRLSVELAVGAAIYAMAAGFAATQFPREHLGYGAPLGFAGAALLLLAAGRRVGNLPPDRKRFVLRLVPMLASLGFLAIPVATIIRRLGQPPDFHSPWQYWYWLTVGAILVALRLLGRWLRGPKADDELVLLPLVLLALTALALTVTHRAFGVIGWESWVSIALCVLLAVLGWLERTSRLESFRVPEEIWRVDRLPEAES